MTRLARLGPTLAPSLGPGLLMLVVALVGAGHPVLSWDEIATADAAARTPGQLWQLIQHIDGVFAPYYYLEHYWTGLAGTTELALRLPSILAMSGAVALAGELGRRRYGPLTGTLAGLLLCLMPNTSRYAAEARPYAFACFFALLALLLLDNALDRPHPARWTLYGLSVFLLGLAHVIALTTLSAHAVVLRSRASRRTVVVWAAAAVPALLALAPVLWLGVRERGAQLSWVPPLTAGLLWQFPGQVVGSVAGGWLLLGLAALGLSRRIPARAETAALALGPIVAVAAVSLLVAPYWVARYLLVVLAPLALLAAAGLRDVLLDAPTAGSAAESPAPASPPPISTAAAPSPPISTTAAPSPPISTTAAPSPPVFAAAVRNPVGVTGVVALVAVLACAVLPAQRTVRTATAKNGSDYRTAAAIITRNHGPADGIAYTAHSRTMRTGLTYYLRHDLDPPRDVLLERTAAADGTLKAVEYPPSAARLAGTRRLWLLVYGAHPDPLTVRPDLRAVLTPGFRRVRIWLLHHETLALFVRRTGPAAPLH